MRNFKHTAVALAVLFAASIVLVEAAYAQEAFGRVGTILERIIATINGTVGKSLATLAVIIVGLAWMFGRMDIKQAGAVIIGIGVVFGASQIVGIMAGA